MASAINEIVAQVASWTPEYDSDIFVKSIYGNSLKTYTGTAETPVRIISMVLPDSGLGENAFVALGKTLRADWQIADMFLLKPTAEGGSLRNSEPQIRNYIKSYITQMQNDRSPTNQSFIEGISADIGEFSYGDNVSYYGANIVLSISEIISA